MRLREPGVAELGARDDRDLAVRGTARGAARRTAPADGRGPATVHRSTLSTRAVDEHAVADDAVLGRREPGGDRRERGGGGRRRDRRDRPALHARRAAASARAWSCTALQPSPSSTSSTTASADRAGLRESSASSARPNSAGTRPATDAPSSAGSTGSTTSSVGRWARASPQAPDQAARSRRASMAGMKVSTRGDYAARALLSLALHGSDRPTSVKEIAERTSLPQPYLEQILLVGEGRGPRALEARRRRRLRARPRRPRRSRSPTSSPRSKARRLPHGRAPRPLRGPLRPAGGVGRRRRGEPARPRARHARRPRRAHARRPPRPRSGLTRAAR